jgi:hypothetical protein
MEVKEIDGKYWVELDDDSFRRFRMDGRIGPFVSKRMAWAWIDLEYFCDVQGRVSRATMYPLLGIWVADIRGRLRRTFGGCAAHLLLTRAPSITASTIGSLNGSTGSMSTGPSLARSPDGSGPFSRGGH